MGYQAGQVLINGLFGDWLFRLYSVAKTDLLTALACLADTGGVSYLGAATPVIIDLCSWLSQERTGNAPVGSDGS
jgi:hypothetical protein